MIVVAQLRPLVVLQSVDRRSRAETWVQMDALKQREAQLLIEFDSSKTLLLIPFNILLLLALMYHIAKLYCSLPFNFLHIWLVLWRGGGEI